MEAESPVARMLNSPRLMTMASALASAVNQAIQLFQGIDFLFSGLGLFPQQLPGLLKFPIRLLKQAPNIVKRGLCRGHGDLLNGDG